MAHKTHLTEEFEQKRADRIRKAIADHFAISESQIEEVGDAFPVSYGFTAQTNDRTFHGLFTHCGFVKKGSITEEK